VFWRNSNIATDKEHRVNRRINSPQLRVISSTGEQIGILPLAEALRKAEEAGLDLVEISPTAQPPVCRIMNYGKFQYEESKRRHAAKKKQKQIQIKEVKFRPGTGVGDYQIKLRNLMRFLEEGNKAKITLRFRGREMAHQEIGMEMLKRLEIDLKEYGTVEQYPRLEGRQMVMLLNPKTGVAKTAKPEAKQKTESKPESKAGA